jgi:hypothetical protein
MRKGNAFFSGKSNYPNKITAKNDYTVKFLRVWIKKNALFTENTAFLDYLQM